MDASSRVARRDQSVVNVERELNHYYHQCKGDLLSMLKLTYTETATYLEHLAQTPEYLVSLRVTLAMRLGQSLLVEPSSAAFLLPSNLPALSLLEDAIQQTETEVIALCIADEETVEVSLAGTWVSFDPDEANGIFVTRLSDRTEYLLVKLWNEAYSGASVMREAGE